MTVQPMTELAESVRDKNIIVGVLAVPPAAAQDAADQLVEAGVKIIFSYSDALIDTPPDVTVHRSNPAEQLLYALYFYLS
jgi:redox-sensing transcriptional repressor